MPAAIALRHASLATAFVLLAACAGAPPRPIPPEVPTPPPRPLPSPCQSCGRIERIDAAAAAVPGRPRGAVLGGVVGGVLAGPVRAPAPGKEAPVAGPAWRIVVLLDSGRRLILTQAPSAGMKVGSRVRVERSHAVLLH